jgi:hypothetical protein
MLRVLQKDWRICRVYGASRLLKVTGQLRDWKTLRRFDESSRLFCTALSG